MKKEYKNADQEYHTKKLREFREDHKKKGLCRYCNQPVVKDKTVCEYHLYYYRFYKKFKGDKHEREQRIEPAGIAGT